MHIPAVAKLLILDDEAAQMTALCNTLEQEGYAAWIRPEDEMVAAVRQTTRWTRCVGKSSTLCSPT